MGTLTDITVRAANTMKRQSNSSTGYQSLESPTSTKQPADKENSTKSKSPHFMTPTFSSSLQSTAADNITPEPSTKSKKAEINNAWMKSAAKRVGFGRTGGGTPRSKKEEPLKNSKAISFPDKLATPSHNRVSNTPPSTGWQPLRVSPIDKPLPNPPRGQNFNPGEFDESKTLIDASDKPLRRRSPPGMALHEEDWPVLFPTRPTSPGTLQEMLRDTGSQLTQQAAPRQKERYPILGNTLRHVLDEEQLPVSRFSTTDNLSRKETSFPALSKLTGANKDTFAAKIHCDDPFKDGVYEAGPALVAKSQRTTSDPSSNLSAGAAAVEKLAQEANPTIEPRQTRTSSLRARLSAGQLIRDGQNRVVGFTDFTTAPELALGTTKRDSLRARKEAGVHQSPSPPIEPVSHPLQTKPSREPIGGNRAPAQFVAGSRRPNHPRRPSSRGSLRNDLRETTSTHLLASSARTAQSRPAPVIPKSEDTKHGKGFQVPTETNAGKSSIPLPRQPMSNMPRHSTGKAADTDLKEVDSTGVNESPDEVAIFGRNPSLEIVQNLDQTLSDSSRDTNDTHTIGQPAETLMDNYGAHVLEAIEESPQHTYKLKHLSNASLEFGPTLKISPSAERIIMGPDVSKDKVPLSKKKSKELDRAVTKADQKDRPSSSQGLSRSESRFGLISTKAREKKVKSADLVKLSPAIENLLRGSHKLTPQPNDESAVPSARGSSISTSVNDPFFDARSQFQTSPEKRNDDDQELNVSREGSRISTLGESTGARSDNSLHTTETLPKDSSIEMGAQSSNGLLDERSSLFEDNTIAAKDFAKKPGDRPAMNDHHIETGPQNDCVFLDEANPSAKTRNVSKDEGSKNKVDSESIIHLPSTPEQRPPKDISNSSSHPPRNSSRTPHPNFTMTKSSPVSPLSGDNRPPTPLKDTPQDFSLRQNNLGSLRGHGTSQLDLSNNVAKRDSTARESSKSQASASKGSSLSIFRGLFHKRSSENEPFKPTKKTDKSKPSTTNTSPSNPFPPISDVHPIHRPTLASLARSTPRLNPTTSNKSSTPQTPSSPLLATDPSSLAMHLLDLSRQERSSPQKERLLQLGSVLVEGITQARNAEKAMEEAKQAARRAEVAHALCRRSLREVTSCVEGWKERI